MREVAGASYPQLLKSGRTEVREPKTEDPPSPEATARQAGDR